jgi:hypothetical protein
MINHIIYGSTNTVVVPLIYYCGFQFLFTQNINQLTYVFVYNYIQIYICGGVGFILFDDKRRFVSLRGWGKSHDVHILYLRRRGFFLTE